jgi:hypothetical protein
MICGCLVTKLVGSLYHNGRVLFGLHDDEVVLHQIHERALQVQPIHVGIPQFVVVVVGVVGYADCLINRRGRRSRGVPGALRGTGWVCGSSTMPTNSIRVDGASGDAVALALVLLR